MTREGGCFCGALRYAVNGEPLVVTHCHCLHCRKLGGAAFVTWATFDPAEFRYIKGKPATVSSRPGVTRSLCHDCGSPISYQAAELPDEIDLTVGTFDDPESVTPEDHVWADRKISLVHLDDGLPRYGRRRSGRIGGAHAAIPRDAGGRVHRRSRSPATPARCCSRPTA
jgi:hypothetical protein